MEQVTRAEHMKWCKERALEYARIGDASNALASMASDLGKHAETRSSVEIAGLLGTQLLMGGMLRTPASIEKFINDFN